MHEQDQCQEGEDPRDQAHHRALEQLGDLLGDLGPGELYLLTDQDRRLLGDVENQLGNRLVDVARRCGWLLGLGPRGLVGLGYSGGSSSNTRRQTTIARRCAAILANAPRAATRPLQVNRLTMSFSTCFLVLV
jgi:hypothetical protein